MIVLNTAHRVFADPDFTSWRVSSVEVVLDGHNFWSQPAAEAIGLHDFGVGRYCMRDLISPQPQRF